MKRLFGALGKNIFVLLAATIAVHSLLNILGNTTEHDAVGDVTNVYLPWVEALKPNGKWLGVALPWVYPFIAWAPILLARWLLPFDYLQSWMLLATLLNLVAVGQLVAWGRRPQAFRGAWFYLLFLVLLGPVAITRLDGISVSLAIFGVASLLATRHRSGDNTSTLAAIATGAALVWFTVSAWLKVWPVALVLALLQRGEVLKRQLATVGIACLVILGVGVLLGGNQNLFSFITMQSGRGLQVESPIAFLWVTLASLGLAHAMIYFDEPLMTFQVSGDGTAIVANLMTAAQLVAILITAWLLVTGRRAGAPIYRLATLTALTATLDLIVFNKVGSPQYQLWLVAPVIMGLVFGLKNWRLPTLSVLALALLTQLVYPLLYNDMIALSPVPVFVLGLRNLGLIALLVWSNLELGALGKPAKNLAIAG